VTDPALAVEALRVTFDGVVALDGIDLSIAPHETVSILGPSGCGKSTLLRAIAGLVTPDSGSVRWNGRDVVRVAPHARGFGLMFQDHALFPHRSVGENVGFGLRMQRRTVEQRRRRVTEMLDLVGLSSFADRSIGTLSGGEAQRVALARALAPAPSLLMLDEPFGSLDRNLRERLTGEVAQLLRQVGVTAIHVTHDQDEAFAVGDRVAVMRAGRIERIDQPAAVWRDPGTEFVARFLGHDNVVELPGTGRVLLRSDALRLDGSSSGATIAGTAIAGTVMRQRFRAGRFVTVVATALGELSIEHDAELAPGASVTVHYDESGIVPLAD
jgi:thiamine transport system ATP-binding protein